MPLIGQTEAPQQAIEAGASVVTVIGDSLQSTVVDLWQKSLEFVPKLAAMLVILMVGYIVAKILRWLARSILGKVQFDDICDKVGLHDVTRSFGLKSGASEILSQLAFWAVMLMFLVASVDALGMDSVTQSINSLLGYLPNLIGAAVIVTFGLVLANLVKAMVTAAAERMGFEYGAALSQLVYGVIVIMIGSLAISQLNLETDLVNRIIEIVTMAVGAALALALGFGTRDMARHVVAGVYARESFQNGTTLQIGDNEGVVESVRAVNTTIRTSDGKTIIVPNGQLMETNVTCSD